MERWAEVDRYLESLFGEPEPALRDALDASAGASLPSIQVSATVGRLLHVLARAIGARRILEIGTLGGYSATWLARALPSDGQVVTLELEQRHADVARANLERAGVGERVEVLVGPAAATLAQLVAVGSEPFDLVFIDADKEGYADYLAWSVRLSRPGALIVADNVVRQGQVVEEGNPDPRVEGVRRFNALVAADPRLSAAFVQTVGAKGYDGMALAVVLPEHSTAR